ncbi:MULTISPECIES: hypothetical protein [unclassified Paenibacillus]|uniref:hypothetical protein n=1 Tax=unclassified Paenibacillus TaxID=185978 RepID=UPI003834BEDE
MSRFIIELTGLSLLKRRLSQALLIRFLISVTATINSRGRTYARLLNKVQTTYPSSLKDA